ncbi:hypothetical protein [Enterovibrio calviensis]|uniref:hypothetical protein n=1 Tax=Enterovibrio calviensis TaxID=91359 RepID=UPI0037362186
MSIIKVYQHGLLQLRLVTFRNAGFIQNGDDLRVNPASSASSTVDDHTFQRPFNLANISGHAMLTRTTPTQYFHSKLMI